MRPLTLCVAVAVLAVAFAAEAKTIRVPAGHKTIQAAVDAAVSGDTVLVSAGTYAEHVKLKEGVTLKSAGDDSPGDHTYEGRKPLKRAEQTIIDVKGSTKGATLGLVAAPYVADNFVFRNKGIGIGSNHRSQTVVVNNVVFENYEAGIRVDDSVATIYGNTVAKGGSVGLYLHDSRVTATRNTVRACTHDH